MSIRTVHGAVGATSLVWSSGQVFSIMVFGLPLLELQGQLNVQSFQWVGCCCLQPELRNACVIVYQW